MKGDIRMSDDNEQRPLFYPNPDEFPSYDDVDSEVGQAELPDDSFVAAAASDDENGCCVR